MRTVELSEKVETIHFYHENGIHVFPIEEKTKLPLILRDQNGNPIQKKEGGKPLFDKFGNPEYARESWKHKYISNPLSLSETIDIFRQNPDSNIGAICGVISGNLFDLDIDNVNQFNREILDHSRELQTLVNSTWKIESTSKGLHFPFLSPFPVKGQVKKNRGYDIKGINSYFLVPPSIAKNKRGELGQYLFLFRESIYSLSESELEIFKNLFQLEPILEENENENSPTNQIEKIHGLSWKLWEILRFGKYEKHGYYPKSNFGSNGNYKKSRSEAEFKILLELVKQSYPFEFVLDIFRKHSNPYSKFRELGTRQEYYLFDSYHKAKDWILKQNGQLRESITIYRSFSKQTDWKTISGHSVKGRNMKGVFDGILNVMERTGKEKVGVSVRELAEMTGCSKRAIQNSLNGLIENNLIESEKNPKSSLYSVCAKVDTLSQLVEVDRMSTFAHLEKTLRELDLFRHGILGKTGLEIYFAIPETGITKSELLDRSNVHRTTLERKLRTLLKLEAVFMRGGLIARNKINPQEIDRLQAIFKGYYGESILAKQRKNHRREREDYKKKLIERREKGTPTSKPMQYNTQMNPSERRERE